MKKERVIELAEEAGITFVIKPGVASATEEWLCSFAQLVRNETLEEAAKALEGTAFTENGIPHRQTQHAGSWQEKSTVGLFVTANAKKLRSLKS